MKKIRNHTFAILTLLVGLIFLLDSCGPTYVRRNRPVVYRRVSPAKVVVVRPYSPPPRPVHANVRIGF
jgi:hypothetical protein